MSVAFILSQFAQQGCQFIGVPPQSPFFDTSSSAYLGVDEAIGWITEQGQLYAGIYCWTSAGGQRWEYGINYNELEFSNSMALATTVMGSVVICFYLFSSCMHYHPAIWFLLSLTLVATTMTQALQFRIFKSEICDVGCTLGRSSRLGISACVFWGVSAVMTCGESLFEMLHFLSIARVYFVSDVHS